MDDDTFYHWDDEAPIPEQLNVEEELERFRHQWQQELHSQPGKLISECQAEEEEGSLEKVEEEPSVEEQAKYLFLQGVNAEQSNRLYDAIKYYRRAVQLVPDIEFRIQDYKPRLRGPRYDSESSVCSSSSDPEEIEDLSQHLRKLTTDDGRSICQPQFEQQSKHISDLPIEILVYIFKWVVSSDLDITSLERLSEVCHGFCVCARDDELWKLICQRVYGVKLVHAAMYGSYRSMYVQLPHLRFNGCYISRLEYYRQGEKGLDTHYKPYQLVEYYRYVRFFPDGTVTMLTSPDNPYLAIPKLKNESGRSQGLMQGYYKLNGDRISGLLKRPRTVDNYAYRYKRRQPQNNNDGEQSFHMEFCLKNAGKRMNSQLVWSHYSIHTLYRSTGQEQINDFDLTPKNYPQLIFSRVKRYTASSESPLQ